MKKSKTEKEILDILRRVPNVTLACKKVGITTQSYYRWRKEDKLFLEKSEEALKIGRETMCDIAEGTMFNLAQNGDFRASKYILDNNRKEYIRPRPKIIYANLDSNVSKKIDEPFKWTVDN